MTNLELIEEESIKVGEICLESDIIISDPCYEIEGYGTAKLSLPFSRGIYDCYYTKHDNRVASIWVILTGTKKVVLGQEVAICGVDSGQLGIFNAYKYGKRVEKKDFETTISNRKFPYEDWKRQWQDELTDEDTFYHACCNLTLSDDGVGVIENVGLVSSSGYGDGAYPVYELKDRHGDVLGFRIDFISQD